MFSKPRVSPLQFLMLLQLNKGPKYGYEMLKALREQFDGVWEARTGTIYPALRSLETRGFVETEMKEDMEFYNLTERGEALLKRVGERLEKEIKFANRYVRFVIEWMPSAMKEKHVEVLRVLAQENVGLPIFIEHFIDETMDRAKKLEILESMKKHIVNRLNTVDKMIEDLEGG